MTILESWQEFLWALPSDMGPWWYVLWGVVGGGAAVVIFVVAVLGQPLSPMFACRVVLCLGLMLIPLAAVNSGLQPWIPAFYALSGAVGALSLTVERCDREMEIVTVGGALVEKIRRLGAVLRRLTGRERRSQAGRRPAG